MKKSLLVLALAAAFSPMLAHAEAGDWVLRLRATNINPSESSKLGEQTDKTLPGGFGATALYDNSSANLSVDSNTIPELDISYYVGALKFEVQHFSKENVAWETTSI